MTPEQRRQFVYEHRTAIFGYNRAQHGPAMSIVYYSAGPEEIVVSTMAARAKAKAVARSPKMSLCVLDEQWPPSYLQVYCDAVIDTDFDLVVDVMMRIAGVMAGTPMSEDVRPMVEEGARPTSAPGCSTRRAPQSHGERGRMTRVDTHQHP
jgi:hypothetical protein